MLRYFIKYIFNILIIFISNYLILLDNKFKSHDSNASNFSKKNLLVLKGLELKELEDSNSFQSFNAHYYLGGQYFLYPPVYREGTIAHNIQYVKTLVPLFPMISKSHILNW